MVTSLRSQLMGSATNRFTELLKKSPLWEEGYKSAPNLRLPQQYSLGKSGIVDKFRITFGRE